MRLGLQIAALLLLGRCPEAETGAPGSPVAAQAAQAALTVEIEVDWANEKVLTHTAATVEVDVMPFLGRTDWGARRGPRAASSLPDSRAAA